MPPTVAPENEHSLSTSYFYRAKPDISWAIYHGGWKGLRPKRTGSFGRSFYFSWFSEVFHFKKSRKILPVSIRLWNFAVRDQILFPRGVQKIAQEFHRLTRVCPRGLSHAHQCPQSWHCKTSIPCQLRIFTVPNLIFREQYIMEDERDCVQKEPAVLDEVSIFRDFPKFSTSKNHEKYFPCP